MGGLVGKWVLEWIVGQVDDAVRKNVEVFVFVCDSEMTMGL